MTPDRASAIFRELLITPTQDLAQFSRRVGLQGNPAVQDLQHAKEILQTLTVALQSGPGPNWTPVTTIWGAMVAKHGSPKSQAMAPQKPSWVGNVPAKPTLGDPAPGTHGHVQQQQQRQRFVPNAQQPTPAPAPAKPEPPPPPQRKPKADSIEASVAKYAAFCAACAAQPDRVFATMVEYGISSPDARNELDEMWNERFDENTQLQQQWEQLFHQFRQKLAQR